MSTLCIHVIDEFILQYDCYSQGSTSKKFDTIKYQSIVDFIKNNLGEVVGAKVDPTDYYDLLPPNLHRTGDIWKDLPNFDLVSPRPTSSLVVTPACDLAQRKVETATFLPILTISEYLNSSGFFFELWLETTVTLQKLSLTHLVIPPERFELPLLEDLEQALAAARQIATQDPQKSSHVVRLTAYKEYIRKRLSNTLVTLSEVGQIFIGSNFDKLLKKITTNGYKSDIHFLPCDGKPRESSAVPEHSVVLFRYASSIPIRLLDVAQVSTQPQWNEGASRIFQGMDGLKNHLRSCPIRLATVKDDFLSDLLSRYVGMQIRLGSRDFSDETIEHVVRQLKEQ